MGWDGWNIIPVIFTVGNSYDGQFSIFRFTFGVTSHSADSQYPGLIIHRILGFGGMGWSTPSNMAKNGHLYSYDSDQNATFPAGLTAGSMKVGSNKVALQNNANDFISSNNEFNFIGTIATEEVWINYRGSSRAVNTYRFATGQQNGNHAKLIASGFATSANSSSKVLTSDGGTKDISALSVDSANQLTWALYEN